MTSAIAGSYRRRAWYIPLSPTSSLGTQVLDTYTGVTIAPGVKIGATTLSPLLGGDNLEVIVDGVVAGPGGMKLGDPTNRIVTGSSMTVGATGHPIGSDG